MRRKSTLERNFNYSIEEVWDVVVDNSDYSWRTDIEKIKIVDEENFTEIYKTGGQTDFRIVDKAYLKFYSFEMSNRFFSGEWIGEFVEINPSGMKLIFTEELNFNNFFVYIISFFAINLKNIQKNYFDDLKRKLENDN